MTTKRSDELNLCSDCRHCIEERHLWFSPHYSCNRLNFEFGYIYTPSDCSDFRPKDDVSYLYDEEDDDEEDFDDDDDEDDDEDDDDYDDFSSTDDDWGWKNDDDWGWKNDDDDWGWKNDDDDWGWKND